jgi:hypothetical protein
MKKYLLALPLLFAAQLSNAQNNTKAITGQFAEDNLKALVMNGGSMARLVDTRYAGVKGTPFFLNDFGLATISMFDNRVYDKIRFNYNVMENTLHYKDDKKVERVLPNTQISEFVLVDSLGTNQYLFKTVTKISGVESKHVGHFSLVLYDGKIVSLNMIPEKQLLKADYKGGYSSEATHDEFVDAKSYYIIKNNSAAEKVKLNKKSLLAVLADKQSEVERYLKKENIDASTEKGWIKALAYYESI